MLGMPVYLSVYLSIYLSIYPFVYLFIYLRIYLFVCLLTYIYIGWMHELDNDLAAAEKCYVYAVELDPVETTDLLNLDRLVKVEITLTLTPNP